MGYITHFLVYVMAMISVIILALLVYKKFSVVNFSAKKSKTLHIEESLNLTPRKTLYVINTGDERFLIAGDLERTTLISKLSDRNTKSDRTDVNFRNERLQKTVDIREFARNEDILYKSQKQPVMKNLVKKLEMEIK